MPNYPYPSEVNMSEGFTNLFVYFNTVTNNWFSNMLLITIYIMFAMGFYSSKRNVGGSFAVGGFATFVFGTLLWIANMISTFTFALVVAVAIGSFGMMWIFPE